MEEDAYLLITTTVGPTGGATVPDQYYSAFGRERIQFGRADHLNSLSVSI